MRSEIARLTLPAIAGVAAADAVAAAALDDGSDEREGSTCDGDTEATCERHGNLDVGGFSGCATRAMERRRCREDAADGSSATPRSVWPERVTGDAVAREGSFGVVARDAGETGGREIVSLFPSYRRLRMRMATTPPIGSGSGSMGGNASTSRSMMGSPSRSARSARSSSKARS